MTTCARLNQPANNGLQATVGGGPAADWRPRSPTAPEAES